MGNSRVEDTYFPIKNYLKLKDKLMDLSTPKVMGILNVTPDSFYSKSRKNSDYELLSATEKMINEGADMLDIGGLSTRPGAVKVDENEELNRVLPAIQLIKQRFPDTPLSLDTFHAHVAREGIASGIEIINDISGLEFDPELIHVLKENPVAYILTFSSKNWDQLHNPQNKPGIFKQMFQFFSQKKDQLHSAGISDVIIDPGFGLHKTMEENYTILHNLQDLRMLESPILVGFSRKSMIYKKLNCTPEEALNGSTILNTVALTKGAQVIRTHDVKETKEILQLLY